MQEKLNITRDCWWAIPSGDTYVTDETVAFASHGHALYTSINNNDAEYVDFHGSGNVNYYARLESSNMGLDHILINLRSEAAISGDASISINGMQMVNFEHVETKATQSKLVELTNEQKERVLYGRIDNNYDYLNITLNTPIASGNTSKKLYDLEVYYSGDATWDNHQVGLPNVTTSTFYPNKIVYDGGSAWSGDFTDIADVGNNSTYIEQTSPGVYFDSPFLSTSTTMPSGCLSIWFNEDVEALTQITRAQLNLTMRLPPSGEYENARSSFEINGYNPYYRDQDYKNELEYLNLSQDSSSSANGYFVYGAGDIIEADNFTTYSNELNFLDPTLPSGEIADIKHMNIDMLAKMEFQLIGMPSGVQISAAALQVEHIPNNYVGLYTAGEVKRQAESSYPDYGTTDSYLLGDGGWHHRGWRDSLAIEEQIFENFYTFSDPSTVGEGLSVLPNTRTFPEEVYAPGYNYDDKYDTVHGIFVTRAPTSYTTPLDTHTYPLAPIFRSELETTPAIKYEYYREPLVLEGINDYGEYTNYLEPSYYRNMVYYGDSLASVDVTEYGAGELSDNIRQIYFPTLSLGIDFTLYFMLYKTYAERNYGVIFDYGGLFTHLISYGTWSEWTRNGSFEVQIFSQPTYIQAYIRSATGYNYSARVDINRNSVEPILVWLNCEFDTTTLNTSFNLFVHDDINNFFGSDWKSSSNNFDGYRYQQSDSRAALGTLSQENFSQHLATNRYLNHLSFCEFGYANESIELASANTNGFSMSGYDSSPNKAKSFLSSRLCNSQYLTPNGSGVNWVVPDGSGATEWSTTYSIDDWTNNNTTYSLYNPVTTAGTNEIVNPSAIYVDIETTHITNNPSGVDILVDVQFDSGTTKNWKVGHTEFNIPSGETTHTIKGLLSHIGMGGESFKYSDADNISAKITTKYVDVDNDYYGNLTINSLNVYFDSYCVAATGLDTLDLYTYGSPTNIPKDPDDGSTDLFVEGAISNNNNMDLYILGIGHISSGNIPLYMNSDNYIMPSPSDSNDTKVNMYIEGLDPPESSGDINLYMWGTPAGVGGIRDDVTMYIKSNLDPKFMLPLYIKSSNGEEDASLNLYLQNTIDNSNNNLPLIINGPSGITDSTTLYISGDGITEGAIPSNTDMNLFMARDSEAVANSLPLYMSQKNVINNLNIVMTGVGIPSSSIPLYMYGSGLPPNNTMDLYTHGY